MAHDQCLFCANYYGNLSGESKEVADLYDLDCTLEKNVYSRRNCTFFVEADVEVGQDSNR